MERDIEKDLVEIECAVKSQEEKDNMFTMSVLQRCHKLVSQLKEYKELEEQGKLLKLPCAVGDTVYRICPKSNSSHDGSCRNCAWENSLSLYGCAVYGLWPDGHYPARECTVVPYRVHWNYLPEVVREIGKRVFLTKEAAEAALREREAGRRQ